MRRIHNTFLQPLLALGSLALFHGSTCVVAYCSEDCNPCITQCVCHTCPHAPMAAFEPSHRLVSYELARFPNSDGTVQETYAWINGLTVIRATGREEVTHKDLREFAEGVLGVNRELLDLPAALGHWTFEALELAEDYALVSFSRKDAAGLAAQGELDFVFDAHGKLLEIDRTLPAN